MTTLFKKIAVPLLALCFVCVAIPALADPCTQAMLGDYAAKPDGDAVLRMEKMKGVLVSRLKGDDGKWEDDIHFVTPMSPDDIASALGSEKDAAKSCGGYVERVGMFIQLPVGAHYMVSSATGKSLQPVASETGYVVIMASGFAVGANDMTRVSPAPAQAAAKPVAQISAGKMKTLHECRECPSMVIVPPGKITLSAPDAAASKQPNQAMPVVTLTNAFAIAQTPITTAQFAAFQEATEYRRESGCTDIRPLLIDQNATFHRDGYSGFTQSGDEPVVCVTWNDAQAYTQWLSKKTGKHYRLPTEAEWEYTCRAGSYQRYCGGDDLDAVSWYGPDEKGAVEGNADASPHAVAQKAPNAWQLYDMTGNVWQWVEDCYDKDYNGMPTDGKAATSGNCEGRVRRGGSWASDGTKISAIQRGVDNKSNATNHTGFRVVRELP